MAKVVPSFQEPSFGERFMSGLGKVASSAAEGIPQILGQKMIQQQRQQALGNEAQALSQMFGMDVSQLMPETRQEFVKAMLKKETSPQAIKQKEQQESKQHAQTAFDRMSNILKEGRIGFGAKARGFFGGKTAEDVGEFDSLTGALESLLVQMVNRGTLSNTRFKYITETLLPKSTDRDSTIKGKLKGLAAELDLDPAALGVETARRVGSAARREKAGSGKEIVLMKDPSGVVRQVPKSMVSELMQHGGIVVR